MAPQRPPISLEEIREWAGRGRLWPLLKKTIAVLERHPETTPESIKRFTDKYFFALLAHEGQQREDGKHYVTHALQVAYRVALAGGSAEHAGDGALHDVLEKGVIHWKGKDIPATYKLLTDLFGEETARTVAAVSAPRWNGRKFVDAESKGYGKVRYPKSGKALLDPEVRMKAELLMQNRVSLHGPGAALIKLFDTSDNAHSIKGVGATEADERRRMERQRNIYFKYKSRLLWLGGFHNPLIRKALEPFQTNFGKMQAHLLRAGVISGADTIKQVPRYQAGSNSQ